MVPPSQGGAGVLWLGLLDGPSGYADEARGFLRALEAAGCAPAARPILDDGRSARLSAGERAQLDRQLRRDGTTAPVAVHHYAPAWMRQPQVVGGVPNVARTMFETDSVPAAWVPQLLLRDEVWVPSEHGREAFERGGVPSSRLRVVGGTLDFDLFAPGAEPLALDAPEGHLVFLSNFEFSERKGWRELLLAWALAFAPEDPVCLVLKTGAPKGQASPRARIDAALADAARAAGRSGTAPVKVMTDTLSPADLVRLYAAAGAYVLASRGEGWGRPYMEALAMGLPTVASRWSGNLEFMREDTSWLVDGELVPVPEDHGVFADAVTGHRWFQPDPESLAAHMSAIAADPAAARDRAAPARDDLIERFGPAATAARIEQAIGELVERERSLAAGGRACRIRGAFGRNASLAIINDRLVEGLEAGGRRVDTRSPGAPADGGDEPLISHSWPPSFGATGQGPTVVILPWEYGHPPREWVDAVRTEVDRVVVPSEYVRAGYAEAGIPAGTVEVVPNGVDLELFTPEGPARPLPRQAGCVFLYVGGTIWRKGIDLLVEAWRAAFTADDDVLLVVKDFGTSSHYRGQTQGAGLEALAGSGDLAPIVYLNEEVSQDELPALYRSADVFVAPYRGEGFGMPILEAMACGLPPIHTGCGPSREFVPADAGWAVPARRVSLAGRPGVPDLAGDGYVHEVEVAALAGALRSATDTAERSSRAAAAAQAARGYGWRTVSERMEEVLATLAAEALPLVRASRPLLLDTRDHGVLYAPGWEDEATWSATLERWARAVRPGDELTLVLAIPQGSAETLGERIVASLAGRGFPAEDLPDLMLHELEERELGQLAASVDAVLVDEADPPAAVRRRARRIVPTAELEVFARGLKGLAADPINEGEAGIAGMPSVPEPSGTVP